MIVASWIFWRTDLKIGHYRDFSKRKIVMNAASGSELIFEIG
jgi:hypothetical protein